MDRDKNRQLSPSDRLPLLLLAKTLDHQAATAKSKLDAAGKRKSARETRELALTLKAK